MTVEGIAPELTPTTEAPPAAETPPKVKDPNEKRWAHMAKQEKAIRAERARITAEREQLVKDRAEIESAKSWRDRLSKGDYDALSDAGVTKEQLTQYIVNQPNPTDREIAMLKAKIAQMEEGQGTIQKSIEAQTQKQYDEAVNQITRETQLLMKSDPDKFEMLSAHQSHDAVVELIKQVFDTEGYMMTVEEACNEVEEYLFEETSKLMGLKKIKAKIAPAPPAPTKLPLPSMGKPTFSTAVRESAAARPAPRTLTHQQIPVPTTPSGKLTEKQRMANAVAVAQGRPRPYGN